MSELGDEFGFQLGDEVTVAGIVSGLHRCYDAEGRESRLIRIGFPGDVDPHVEVPLAYVNKPSLWQRIKRWWAEQGDG